MSNPAKHCFRERVLAVIRRIPHGRVATYGQVAALAGAPRAARQVGWILHRSGEDDLPWHRVINSQGRISLPPYGGHDLQRALLLEEAVEFDHNDRVDLQRFGWHGDQTAAR